MNEQSKTPQAKTHELFSGKSAQYARSSLLTDRENLARVKELTGISPDDLVLDVATGTGYMAAVAAEAGAFVVATDFTLNMLLETRRELERWNKNTLALVDADHLAFADCSFNVVACRVSVHHFANPGIAIREMARVCKTGGTVMIMDVVSSEDRAKSDLHNKMGQLRDPSEVRQWQLSEIEQMMISAGLTITDTETWSHVMAFDEWIRLGGADSQTAEQLREMMIDSIEGDKAGINPHFVDDELHFTWTTGILVASK